MDATFIWIIKNDAFYLSTCSLKPVSTTWFLSRVPEFPSLKPNILMQITAYLSFIIPVMTVFAVHDSTAKNKIK